jgi:hypothetical protein
MFTADALRKFDGSPAWLLTRWTMGIAGSLAVVLLLGSSALNALSIQHLGQRIRQDERYAQQLAEGIEASPDSSAELVLHQQPRPDPSISTILVGLSTALRGSDLEIIEIAEPASGVGGVVRTRISLQGNPESAVRVLSGLEEGPTHLLVTSVAVEVLRRPDRGTSWLITGVLP